MNNLESGAMCHVSQDIDYHLQEAVQERRLRALLLGHNDDDCDPENSDDTDELDAWLMDTDRLHNKRQSTDEPTRRCDAEQKPSQDQRLSGQILPPTSRPSLGFVNAALSRQLGSTRRRLTRWAGDGGPKFSGDLCVKRSLSLIFNKAFLEFCGLFCQVDLYATESSPPARALAPPPTGAPASVPDSSPTRRDRRGRRLLSIPLPAGLPPIPVLSYSLASPSPWFQAARRKLWPRLLMLYYLFAAAHVFYYLYHQYTYDFYNFRLNRVRWLNLTQPPEVLRERRLETEDFLLEQLRVRAERLKCIGAPHLHLSFAVQCMYMLNLGVPLLSYLGACLYFRFRTPFNFYFIRSYLSFGAERRHSRRLVRDQVRRFLESNQNYSRALVEFSKKSVGKRLFFERYANKLKFDSSQSPDTPLCRHRRKSLHAGTRQTTPLARIDLGPGTGGSVVAADGKLDELILGESASCKQVRQMYARGHLRPINLSARWVRQWSGYYSVVAALCFLYGVVMNLAINYTLFVYIEPTRALTWRDQLMFGGVAWMTTINTITTVFYGTTLVFACIDQATLANQLRKAMQLSIALNRLRFYRNLQLKCKLERIKEAHRKSPTPLREPSVFRFDAADVYAYGEAHTGRHLERKLRRKPVEVPVEPRQCQRQRVPFEGSYEHKMNHDLLLVVMHYRIFQAQLMGLRRAMRAIVVCLVVIMFLVPITARLHMPYFNSQIGREMRLMMVILSFVVIVPVNICLLPVCYLNKRCLDLYYQLNGLLAHATDVLDQPEGRDIYDRHIISMLRKEMCHPEHQASQFAVKFLSISVTYSSVVRLHFYFGFILLSVIVENQASEQELSGTLFNDPFGLF